MSLFKGIENAKVTDRLPYMEPGKYLLQLENAKIITSRAKEQFAVAEFKILQSEGEGANEVGTSTSQMIKLSLDAALGNIKTLVAALLGIPSAQVTESAADEVFGPSNSAKGVKVRAEAFHTDTKSGGVFTRVNYLPYQGETTSTAAPVAGVSTSTAVKSKSARQ